MLKMFNKICDLKVNFDDDKKCLWINKKLTLKMTVLGVDYLNFLPKNEFVQASLSYFLQLKLIPLYIAPSWKFYEILL